MAWVLAHPRDARKMKAADQDEALERLGARFNDEAKPTFVWQLDFAEVFHRCVAADVRRLTSSSKAGLQEKSQSLRKSAATTEQGGFDLLVGNSPSGL